MIVGIGDSFIYGFDLSDCTNDQHSLLTWPALIAQQLGHEYRCYARPGVGNLHILDQCLTAIAEHGDQAMYFVNWSWTDRYNYVDPATNEWRTIRPDLVNPTIDEFYYRNLHSEFQDKLTSLSYITTALDHFGGKDFIMTYMDKLLLDQQWHATPAVQLLQQRVKPHLRSFNSKTFLNWSRDNNFEESASWHPLESAHKAAADYWLCTSPVLAKYR